MTQNKKWKKLVRARAKKLGVPYREALRQMQKGDAGGSMDKESDAAPGTPGATASAPPSVLEPAGPQWSAYDEKADYFTSDPTRTYRLVVRQRGRMVERTLRVGEKYVVEPLNSKSTKHRGRAGILRKLRHDYLGSPQRASLTFIDGKGSHGVVDVASLRELTMEEKAALEAGTWPPPPRRASEDEARERARPSSLTQTRFSREDFTRRPPIADVQALWNAAKRLDDPSLATDSSSEYLFKHVFPAALVDVGRLAMTGVARWLSSYAERPCTWWGSPRLADIYRLAVRAYEPNGVLGALCAVATAEAVSVKTGQPISRQTVKWPRPWRTDGLLLADETGLAVLQGRAPETLKVIIIADHALNFIVSCAAWSAPVGSANAGLGIIGLASGAHVEDLASVRWPRGVLAVYAPPKVGADTRAVLKRLRRVLGPGVSVTNMADFMAHAMKSRAAAS